jgi:UDP-N-acetyl-D-mannosaminuronate dehydrogenase
MARLAKAISTADTIVVLVDHLEFKGVTRADLGDKQVIDTRGILRLARP